MPAKTSPKPKQAPQAKPEAPTEAQRGMLKGMREWRELMGYTQVQAADALGMTERMIQYMEAGEPIEHRTRLAMAALAKRLSPWG